MAYGMPCSSARGLVCCCSVCRWLGWCTRWIPPDQCWSEEDHRAFRVGAIWFVVALVPTVVALGIVSFVGHGAVPGTAEFGVASLLAMNWSRALLGAMVGWWALYLLGLGGTIAFKRNAMGYGDVKLLAVLGALVGPDGVLVTVLTAVFLASVIGVPARLMGGGREIPFGPFLAVGAVVALIVGGPLLAVVLPAAS